MFDSRSAESITAVVVAILPVAATIVVLGRRIVKEPSVNAPTILGLLSIYPLLGMTFAALFETIAVISDEPFFAQSDTVGFTYFSFVTLSTVGFGARGA